MTSQAGDAEIFVWSDTIALNTIARTAGITLAQARVVLLGLVALPEEQTTRIIETSKASRQRALDARTRREEEAEKARRRARGETV